MRTYIACIYAMLAVTVATSAAELRQGDRVAVNGQTVTIRQIDETPLVDSEYSRRFRFDAHDNPKLKALREKYKLDEVIASGKTEFEQQVLLLNWVHEQIHKFGRPTSKARGALDILQANEQGHTFFCAHYGDVMVSAAASLGWVDRSLALRRPDHLGSGATEHTATEIWSNQYRKWVLFDPTFAMYVEKDGTPLNAYEVRQEWFVREGRDLVFVVGKDRKRHRRADFPIVRKRFDGFGNLQIDDSALNVYAFIGYIPNTNLMDGGFDYAGMFITQDQIGGATKWHKRKIPESPAIDPYFPIGGVDVTINPDATGLAVQLKTLTPNLKAYQYRVNAGPWAETPADLKLTPTAGETTYEFRTINQNGVPGPAARIAVEAAKP